MAIVALSSLKIHPNIPYIIQLYRNFLLLSSFYCLVYAHGFSASYRNTYDLKFDVYSASSNTVWIALV